MKHYYSILSGSFAASGSVFGKLSGVHYPHLYIFSYIVQALCLGLMIALNTVTLTYYVKAMQVTSSYKATVLSAATNYLLSGLFGIFLFGEVTGLLWWSGISFVLLGLVIIQTSKDQMKND